MWGRKGRHEERLVDMSRGGDTGGNLAFPKKVDVF